MVSLLIIWSIAALCMALVWMKPAGARQQAVNNVRQNAMLIAFRMPFAILTAGFAGTLLPQDLVSDWIGEGSGAGGIVIASFLGLFVPGGPIISFPIALALAKAGAGLPQLIAFLTSWSVFEPQRMIIWEWPLLGAGFLKLRLAVSCLLPLAAGFTAAALVQLWPA